LQWATCGIIVIAGFSPVRHPSLPPPAKSVAGKQCTLPQWIDDARQPVVLVLLSAPAYEQIAIREAQANISLTAKNWDFTQYALPATGKMTKRRQSLNCTYVSATVPTRLDKLSGGEIIQPVACHLGYMNAVTVSVQHL
jgi:hypothetical protein